MTDMVTNEVNVFGLILGNQTAIDAAFKSVFSLCNSVGPRVFTLIAVCQEGTVRNGSQVTCVDGLNRLPYSE